jgi:hypothetical protein
LTPALTVTAPEPTNPPLPPHTPHTPHHRSFTGLEQFLNAYSASRAGSVARAALHLQLAQQATLEQAAAAAGAPPAPPPLTPAQQPWAPSPPMLRAAASCLPPSLDLGDDADLFVEQALIAVGNWVQALLLNPARHRRRLRRGLEDWCHLYQHAVNADCSEAFGGAAAAAGWVWRGVVEYPGPVGPLSGWVERQTAWIVAAHLLMGFELDLYEPRDYAMLYWWEGGSWIWGAGDVGGRGWRVWMLPFIAPYPFYVSHLSPAPHFPPLSPPHHKVH